MEVARRQPSELVPARRPRHGQRVGRPREDGKEAAAQLQKLYLGSTLQTWARRSEAKRLREGGPSTGIPNAMSCLSSLASAGWVDSDYDLLLSVAGSR